MNIITGATGQVGSYLIHELKRKGLPVRAVIRSPDRLADKTIETKTADLFNTTQLTDAFEGGTTVFLLTPENPASTDIIGDTRQITENYLKAVQATGIRKIVGLSCIGAHVNDNTGNILMSGILEQGLEGTEAEKIFIRPSYYFSNWLGYMETINQYGVLPTFFPQDLKIEMLSPADLAKFIAEVMADESSSENKKIYELTGPHKYSSLDIAHTFSEVLNRDVSVQTIPEDKWHETLISAGFTGNTATNLSAMTQAVISNKTAPEFPDKTIKLTTTFEAYLKEQLKNRATNKSF